MIQAYSSNNMKTIAVLLALLLVTGALLINVPVQASTDGENDEGSEGGESNEGGESTEEETEEPEIEPEPELEPAPADPPVDDTTPTEPVVPVEPAVEPLKCDEGFVLNEARSACIIDPEVETSAFSLPPECEGMTPLECLGEKIGAPPPECDNLSPLECLDLVIKEPPIPVEPEPEPIDPCLLDPGHESCPEPVDGVCPEGYNMNEDGQCYPEHERCPAGYHSHEDDESGKCIPDSTPCDDGYIMNPDFPSCDLKDRVCEEHPTINECKDNDDDDDNDIDIRIKTVIKNIDIHKTIHNTADFPEVDVIGLSLKDSGEAMICIMNIDNDWVQCQEFGVADDRINENIWRVIETDSDKDYDNGNTGANNVDLAIGDIKDYDFDELDDDRDNHDFNIDLAALGINSQGDGLVCLIEDDRNEGTALCEPFKVSNQAISGQITEIIAIES